MAVREERKVLTAVFADIVGSTALGERLEPDEAKVLVGECVTMMGRAVEEYGGTVQAYQGDGICAYFGVPAAHEPAAHVSPVVHGSPSSHAVPSSGTGSPQAPVRASHVPAP